MASFNLNAYYLFISRLSACGFFLLPTFSFVFVVVTIIGSCGCCITFEPVKFTNTKEKHINEGKNAECPITYEEIKDGDTYMTCDACKYNFSESAIVKHLNKSKKRKCPMCRAEWTNYCKYINKDNNCEMMEKVKNLIDTIKFPIIDDSINKKDIWVSFNITFKLAQLSIMIYMDVNGSWKTLFTLLFQIFGT